VFYGKGKSSTSCMACRKPFKRNDKVYTDTMFTQILHVKCFIYKREFIKDTGTYQEIVEKYPLYQRSFIVTDKPITDLMVVSSLKRK